MYSYSLNFRVMLMFATLIVRVTLISRFKKIREIKVSRKFHVITKDIQFSTKSLPQLMKDYS